MAFINGKEIALFNVIYSPGGVLPEEPDPDPELETLAGTSWSVDEGWTATAGCGRFNVDYDYTGTEFSMEGATALLVGYSGNFGDDLEDSFITPTANDVRVYSYGGSIEAGAEIRFTGGDDATNLLLIQWVVSNCSRIMETDPELETLDTPTISLDGDILTIGINNPCTVYCDILVDGEVKATVTIEHEGGSN